MSPRFFEVCFSILILLNVRVDGSQFVSKMDSNGEIEAIKIALEATGELLPGPMTVNKIRKDLHLIRQLNSDLIKKIHTGKWEPGKLITNADLSPSQIKEVEESEFKPVKIERKGGDTIFRFIKPYHPEKLAALFQLRFGIDAVPFFNGNGEQIIYRDDLSNYIWHSKNGRNCLNGCYAQYSVSFSDERKNELKNRLLNQL